MLLRVEDATPNDIPRGDSRTVLPWLLDSESCGRVDPDAENAVDADVENAAEEEAGVMVLLTEGEGHARD